ncbi:MAG: flavodoxin [Erysipelotrichaceae bacterium]
MSVKDKKVLLAYFSHNKGEKYAGGKFIHTGQGNTQLLAKAIQKELNCDCLTIRTTYDYPYNHFEAIRVSKEEFNKNMRPELAENIEVNDYDVIILGYPNWMKTMPMVMWTFLESHDFSNKVIMPYCTHEGSGLGNSVEDIKKLTNAKVLNPLAIRGSDITDESPVIIDWLKTL